MRKVFVILLVTGLAPVAGAQVRTPALPAPGSRPTPTTIEVDRVVAVVGDQPLLWSDVLTVINQQRAAGAQIPQDSASQDALARDVLNQLIDEEILVQKAHEMKVDVTEAEVNRSVDDQLKHVRDQFKSDEEYKTELKNAGFGTPDEYRRTLYQQFYRRALQQRVFPDLQKTAHAKNVSDAEVEEAFQKNKNQLEKQPATVTFRQIIVAPKPTVEQKKRARAIADSILAEIRKG
jgi:peptidyl-prolyl cis-trans isomerase SurA